ncbi:MAG TPA: efflux RND transporter periplasmic adaptor subunit [Cytophagaceae bacterium]|jgi:RND family efflux transporter MFP subunit|nr:efflux RND transporter periplasmic adaptor subunit [Cytophagaceae bacterium]
MRTQNTIILVTILALLSACGGGSSKIETIKAQIEKNKKQQSDLGVELEKLEKELIAAGDSSSKKTKVLDISVMTVTPKEFKHYLEVQGKVDSDKNVLVSAKVAGTITKILVNKGDYVRAGSVLATIDDETMRKGVQELQSNLNLAKTVYEKQQALWNQKIGTEVQYLQAKTNYESLQRRSEQMKEQQDMYKVKATIDGTVDEIYPNEGEMASPGSPAFRIINVTGFKVIAEIGEGYIDNVKKGDKVSVYFPDINYTMETTVKVVSDVISTVNRTFIVEFDLKNAPKNLKANMLTYVKIQDYSVPSALVIPINVIQHSESGDFVYTVKDKKALKTAVKLGNTYRTDAEVVSGLHEGDVLVTVGYQDLVDGESVKY